MKNKKIKFLNYLQIMMAARKYNERWALESYTDALLIQDREFERANTSLEMAEEYLKWRNDNGKRPFWLTEETCGNILVG